MPWLLTEVSANFLWTTLFISVCLPLTSVWATVNMVNWCDDSWLVLSSKRHCYIMYTLLQVHNVLQFIGGCLHSAGSQMAAYRNCQCRTLTVEWVLREWCQSCRAKCLTTILICLLHSLFQYRRLVCAMLMCNFVC